MDLNACLHEIDQAILRAESHAFSNTAEAMRELRRQLLADAERTFLDRASNQQDQVNDV